MSASPDTAPGTGPAWRRLGLIFAPRGERSWLHSHAAVPTPLPLGGNDFRIYFTSRDERSRSHVGYVEIDITRPTEIRAIADHPVLAPGPAGHFDHDGVYGTGLLVRDGRVHLYYAGWTAGRTAPLFTAAIGLAVSDDDGRTFHRVSPAPIMDRNETDPCLVTAPWVIRDGDRWRMWYVSATHWETTPAGPVSHYTVFHAESDDGRRWRRDGRPCIVLTGDERNIGRPFVRFVDGRYRMWYCHAAGAGYTLGYAESDDGLDWTRRDEHANLGPSTEAWDSDETAYPAVFEHAGRTYLLYNGNDHGRDGFGLAVRT